MGHVRIELDHEIEILKLDPSSSSVSLSSKDFINNLNISKSFLEGPLFFLGLQRIGGRSSINSSSSRFLVQNWR
jgi:hypothetical protein